MRVCFQELRIEEKYALKIKRAEQFSVGTARELLTI
jgi:hypothetical protein